MELGNQIKKYRDINSLIRLSEVFQVSLEILIKGDLEKMKKEFDIQTYKEIIAFTEGKNLDEISKAREEGKRPYPKVSLAFLAAIATTILSLGIMYLLTKFF